MKTYIAFVCTTAIAGLFVGCASSSHVLVGTKRLPISPELVRVYFSPPPAYEEVALLDASSRNSWAFSDQGKMNKAIKRLKEQAAQLGANGILLRGAGDQYGGAVSTGSASAIASGNTATAFGTGISAPIMHKSAAGIAIYVSGDNSPHTPKEWEPIEHLRMLKELLDEGIITRDEFEARKKKILDGQ